MKCMKCNGETTVLRTLRRPAEDAIARERRCDDCGHRFETIEVHEAVAKRAFKILETFQQIRDLVDGKAVVRSIIDRLAGATVVYRHYDATDALLYVGIANRLKKRTAQHRRKSTWFHLVVRTTEVTFATRSEALVEELRAIREERPQFNVAGRIESEDA